MTGCAGRAREMGAAGRRASAPPSSGAAAPRRSFRVEALLAVVAALVLMSPPAVALDGAHATRGVLRELEGRLEDKLSSQESGMSLRPQGLAREIGDVEAGSADDVTRSAASDAPSAWWPEEGDCSAMLSALTSMHARRNYLAARAEDGGDSWGRDEEALLGVSREPRRYECSTRRRGALLSAEVSGWPSAARDKATGAAAVRAADAADGNNRLAERPLIYWMHERKAGGDLVKGCIGVPTRGHDYGFRTDREELPLKRQAYCNRSQSLLANTSALTMVEEYLAAPVMCMHDEAVARRSSFVTIVRHPLHRWQSEMSWSSVFDGLNSLWQLFADEPPPLGGPCPKGRPCTGKGGIREYLRGGKISPRPPERVSDEQLEAAVRDLRSWMDNTWGKSKACSRMRDKDLTAAGQHAKTKGGGRIDANCYIDNYLVRLLSQNCSCPMGYLSKARGNPLLLNNYGIAGCGINFHRRVTYEDFVLARQAAASFNAIVPLERLGCDAKRAFALLGGNAGASMHPDFMLPPGHHESVLELQILKVPELRAVLEADNMYDLMLYEWISQELYPSYFCEPPLVSPALEPGARPVLHDEKYSNV